MSKDKKPKYTLKITKGGPIEYESGWFKPSHRGYTGTLHHKGRAILSLFGPTPEAVKKSAEHRIARWAEMKRADKNSEWVDL